MATPTVFESGNTVVAIWTNENDNGDAIAISAYPDKTIQRSAGTGTVTVEGSVDGTNWYALNQVGSTAGTPVPISLTTGVSTAQVILENTVFIRPVVTGGTATVAIVGTR